MMKIETLHAPFDYPPGSDLVVFDFSDPEQTALWLPINDVIMGGVSSGNMIQHTATTALFQGTVSLERGGGFSSVRTASGEYNLGGFSGLTLVAKGDGKGYKLNTTAKGSASDVLFQAKFETSLNQWIALKIPFSDFLPTFRGRLLPDHSPLDTACIRTFGLMISEKQAGNFSLEVALITAWQ